MVGFPRFWNSFAATNSLSPDWSSRVRRTHLSRLHFPARLQHCANAPHVRVWIGLSGGLFCDTRTQLGNHPRQTRFGKGGASWKLYAHMQVRIIAPATHKPQHTFGETKGPDWGAGWAFGERCVDPALLQWFSLFVHSKDKRGFGTGFRRRNV